MPGSELTSCFCGCGFVWWFLFLVGVSPSSPPPPPRFVASVFLGDKVHLLSLTFPIAQVRCLDAFLASSAGALEVGDQ